MSGPGQFPGPVTTVIRAPQPEPLTLDAARAAVVVVDMENYWVKRGDPRALAVIEGNERLIQKARDAGAKVIYVQSVRLVESLEHTAYGIPLRLLDGSPDVQIVEEIAPLPGEPVIKKWSHDVWPWYGLEALLADEKITADEWTILATGVSAAGCVRAAALGFCHRHYRTVIPMDCGAASTEAAEMRTYTHYQSAAYRTYVSFTLSTMVDFS